jgi:hypothetical protein
MAYKIAIRQVSLKDRPLRPAVETVLECIGASSVFMAVNLILGAAIILATRGWTSLFVSLYIIGDFTLVILSIFQGFLFQLWWRK